MSPGPIQRLKPYFKPRPRARPGVAPAAAQPQAYAAQPQAYAPVAVPSPDGSALRARHEQLARRYAELQSDLGGLVYEMAIRDSFKLDVVVRRAAELQAVDSELSAVEQQLGLAPAPQAISAPAPAPQPAAAFCPSCGAAVQAGAQYCGRCGSTVAAAPVAPEVAR